MTGRLSPGASKGGVLPVPHEPASPATQAARAPRQPMLSVPRTRAGAVWAGLGAGAAVFALLVVFMLQNTAPVAVTFLGMHGAAPLALMLLIAGVAVAVLALTVGFVRSGQSRRRRVGSARRAATPTPRKAL